MALQKHGFYSVCFFQTRCLSCDMLTFLKMLLTLTRYAHFQRKCIGIYVNSFGARFLCFLIRFWCSGRPRSPRDAPGRSILGAFGDEKKQFCHSETLLGPRGTDLRGFWSYLRSNLDRFGVYFASKFAPCNLFAKVCWVLARNMHNAFKTAQNPQLH